MKKLVFLAVVLIGFAATSFAQVGSTLTGYASANIQAALSLTKGGDLNFGNIFPGATSGTVDVVAQEAANRTFTGGTTAASGSGNAAKFILSGVTGAHQVSWPASLDLSDGTHHMTVTFATHVLAVNIATNGGSTPFYVGGSLAVAAAQAPGYYKNETEFVITIDN